MAKKYIKEEIIHAARRLFNEQGYNNVSMRDVADALKISVGNLTYHYKRKEDLMEAVVEDLYRYEAPPRAPENLPQLNALFARMQNSIRQNAFYFWHYTQPGKVPAAVHRLQTGLVQSQRQALEGAFQNLCRSGLFKKEPAEGHWAQLAQAVQILCIYWEPQSLLEAPPGIPNDFLACAWSPLLPLLTEKGEAEYREKVVKVRMEFDSEV